MVENDFDAKKQREFTQKNISEAGFRYKEDEEKKYTATLESKQRKITITIEITDE